MARIIEASIGRPDHYKLSPITPGTSALDGAQCECGATWVHDESTESFCDWAMHHEAPQ